MVPLCADGGAVPSEPWAGVVPDYLASLRAAHRSPGTIRLHRHYLRHVAGYVPRPLAATTKALTAALAVPSWSAETRKSARGVVVSFYRWAHGSGLIDSDPSRPLPPISVPSREARPAPETVLARAWRSRPRGSGSCCCWPPMPACGALRSPGCTTIT